MGLKQGLHGLKGERGKKGDMGNEYTFNNGYKDICYYKLIEYSNAVMEKYKDDSNPVIEYPPNTSHLNNLLFKEQLKRICYSDEFEDDFTSNNMELKVYLEGHLKVPVEKWISKILEYKKGLFFLSDHFANTEDIHNYLKVENIKIIDIEKELVDISEYWKWGKCKE